MARCPDCNRFVSYDADSDPEVDVSVDSRGVVTVSARITNNCEDCGTELREGQLTDEVDFSTEVGEHGRACTMKGLSAETEDDERTERTQNKDRHGKPIKNPRYAKHFYGAEGSVRVTCDTCKKEIASGSWSGEIQAGFMDDLT